MRPRRRRLARLRRAGRPAPSARAKRAARLVREIDMLWELGLVAQATARSLIAVAPVLARVMRAAVEGVRAAAVVEGGRR